MLLLATGVSIHGALLSVAHPPLGEVSRLDNTNCEIIINISHFPDLPDGVSSDVILQYGVIIVLTIVISVKATCKYYNTDNL